MMSDLSPNRSDLYWDLLHTASIESWLRFRREGVSFDGRFTLGLFRDRLFFATRGDGGGQAYGGRILPIYVANRGHSFIAFALHGSLATKKKSTTHR